MVEARVRKSGWPWLGAFVATAIWVVPGLHPFFAMCAICLSLFGLIKLHTLLNFLGSEPWPGWIVVVGWFVAWPGLDAAAFFKVGSRSESMNSREVVFAISKTLVGCWLLFGIAPRVLGHSEFAAGWTALVGAIFILHFGSFHLLAIFWRSRGRMVKPIMNAPILATSVSDFWSKRWNLAFRDYAYPNLFKPLARRWSPTAAVAGGYAFSGVVHELAISVPVGSGFGLPTLYFAVQGMAILLERRLSKANIELRGGWRGWCWTALVTAPGALLLFHPPFVRSVVVPLVEFLNFGATP